MRRKNKNVKCETLNSIRLISRFVYEYESVCVVYTIEHEWIDSMDVFLHSLVACTCTCECLIWVALYWRHVDTSFDLFAIPWERTVSAVSVFGSCTPTPSRTYWVSYGSGQLDLIQSIKSHFAQTMNTYDAIAWRIARDFNLNVSSGISICVDKPQNDCLGQFNRIDSIEIAILRMPQLHSREPYFAIQNWVWNHETASPATCCSFSIAIRFYANSP